jgi:WD40 repeat protein
MNNTLFYWTGEQLVTLEGHSGYVNSVIWSPDGSKVVSGSEDKTIRIWHAASGTLTTTLRGHSTEVRSVAWSPDGSKVVSGSMDKTIRIWDGISGTLTTTLQGHSSGVTSVAWSPDGSQVVSGSWDNTIRIWDAFSSTLTITLQGNYGWSLMGITDVITKWSRWPYFFTSVSASACFRSLSAFSSDFEWGIL